jgi:hypothetical protein
MLGRQTPGPALVPGIKKLIKLHMGFLGRPLMDVSFFTVCSNKFHLLGHLELFNHWHSDQQQPGTKRKGKEEKNTKEAEHQQLFFLRLTVQHSVRGSGEGGEVDCSGSSGNARALHYYFMSVAVFRRFFTCSGSRFVLGEQSGAFFVGGGQMQVGQVAGDVVAHLPMEALVSQAAENVLTA